MTQDKRAPSMTMQERARLSRLEFLDDSSSGPQWSMTREEHKRSWVDGDMEMLVL